MTPPVTLAADRDDGGAGWDRLARKDRPRKGRQIRKGWRR